MTREELIKAYPHLMANPSTTRSATNNVRAELKKHFPGIKFSVRYSSFAGGDSVDIEWYDGPTVGAVESVVGKFQNSHADHTGDYWDYNPSEFNRVFGGFKFVCTDRSYTNEVVNPIIEQVRKDYPGLSEDSEIHRDEFFSKYNCVDEGLSDLYWLSVRTIARFRWSRTSFMPEIPVKEETEPVMAEGIEIVDYSDKAIAVIGNTKPYKGKLMELGGRFNKALKCGAGWVFQKTKKDEVAAALGLKEEL